jgi:hypothetical protein
MAFQADEQPHDRAFEPPQAVPPPDAKDLLGLERPDSPEEERELIEGLVELEAVQLLQFQLEGLVRPLSVPLMAGSPSCVPLDEWIHAYPSSSS